MYQQSCKDPSIAGGEMTPIDIEERNIRLPHSIGGSTNASISELPEAEESCCQLGFRRYWLSEIDRKWTDILLVVCGYVSGLLDGLSFNYWGSFSNMQTGMYTSQYKPIQFMGIYTLN